MVENPLTKTEKKELKDWANVQFIVSRKYKEDPIRSAFWFGRSVGMGKVAQRYNPRPMCPKGHPAIHIKLKDRANYPRGSAYLCLRCKATYSVSGKKVADIKLNPLSQFCCSKCGACAPKSVLAHGGFEARMNWLRHHYQDKHPAEFRKWGKNPTLVVNPEKKVIKFTQRQRDLMRGKKKGDYVYLPTGEKMTFTAWLKEVHSYKNPIHPQAIESLNRYKDDLKAGHKDAAEYWRGQAGAYFTANPISTRAKLRLNKLYKKDKKSLEEIVSQYYKVVDTRGTPKATLISMIMEAEFSKTEMGWGNPKKKTEHFDPIFEDLDDDEDEVQVGSELNPILETIGAGIVTGLSVGSGFVVSKKIMDKLWKNPISSATWAKGIDFVSKEMSRGVPYEKIISNLMRKFKLNNQEATIIYSATYESWKNPTSYLSSTQAVRVLRDVGSHPEAYMVGQGKKGTWDDLAYIEKYYPILIYEYLDVKDKRVRQMFPSLRRKK